MMIPVLLLVAPTLASAVASGPFHIPLTRHQASDLNLDYPDIAADRLRKRYSFDTLQKRQSSSGIPLINQLGDLSYLATVSVGTPAQSFSVVMGTASSDFWLASTGCLTCTSSIPLFNPTESSSFRTTSGIVGQVNISYGSGWAFGQNATDTLTLGDFTAFSQAFLTVTQLAGGIIDGPASGVMGFGFQSISSSGAMPFWQVLLNAHKLSSPLFSFWLTRFNNNSLQDLEPGGIMTLGGTNSTLYTGDIEYIDIPAGVNSTYWLSTITGLSMNGNSIAITPSTSLSTFDIGTTLIGGPTDDVNRIWAAVPGAQALNGVNTGFFSIPCTTQFEVTISFGGKPWPINSDDMKLKSGTICLGAIFDLGLSTNTAPGGSSYPRWVIGDTFLKNVYSVFRATPPAIGFAQLSGAAGGPATSSSTAPPSTTSTPISQTSTSTSRSTPTSLPFGASSAPGALFKPNGNPFLAVTVLLVAGCLTLV